MDRRGARRLRDLPLWSSASVGAIPLDSFRVAGRASLDEDDKRRIASEVVTAAEQIIRGKGATNYAIGLASARIIEAVVRDENRVMPVCSLLTGYQGAEHRQPPRRRCRA